MKNLMGVRGFHRRRPTSDSPRATRSNAAEEAPDATIRVPGSKSVTNRALIIAALAEGHSRIFNPLFSDDSFWLMNALVSLGIGVSADKEKGEVYVSGQSGEIEASGVDLFVGNAGTVARFLPPVLALGRGPYTVDGVPRMRERPVSDLVDAMRQLGASVDYAGEDGRFPSPSREAASAAGRRASRRVRAASLSVGC